jgi:hypothetical protein
MSRCVLGARQLLGEEQAAATDLEPIGRTDSSSRLDILEWCGLGPTVTQELLQHHGAPTTSYLDPGLGRRLWCFTPHHSINW